MTRGLVVVGQRVEITALDPDINGAFTYCEDDRPSMRQPGRVYSGLDIKQCVPPVEVMEPELQEHFCEKAAAFMDLEAGPAEGPAAKRTRRYLMENKRVKEERRGLHSRL